MPLDYIIRQVARKTGLSVNDADNKQIVLDIIQEAGKELYEAADYSGCLEEVVIQCVDNTSISLPPFIGIPRAAREAETFIQWKFSTMRPRYHDKAWPQAAFRNFRDKGVSPLCRALVNTAPPTIRVTSIDSDPISVTIVGATLEANRVVETKLINALDTIFDNAFINYELIKKDKINACNVSILDVDGNEISVIYNNEFEASFRIIDVTAYPITPRDASGTFFIELLYKKKFPTLFNDTDQIPISGYDDIIVNKACQLFSEDKGNIEKAALYDKKAERSADRKSADANKGHVMIMDTKYHSHDEVFMRMKWRSRFRTY